MSLTDLLFILLTLGLLLIALGVVAFEIYAILIADLKGAPFVPSRRRERETMLRLAAIRPGERVADLGSGAGSLVLAAAAEGAKAVGVDINPFLIWYSRLRNQHHAKQAFFLRKDMKDVPLHDLDVVFLYLLPRTMTPLAERLRKELKPGARVVSNTFPLPGWTPLKTEDGVFLYQKE